MYGWYNLFRITEEAPHFIEEIHFSLLIVFLQFAFKSAIWALKLSFGASSVSYTKQDLGFDLFNLMIIYLDIDDFISFLGEDLWFGFTFSYVKSPLVAPTNKLCNIVLEFSFCGLSVFTGTNHCDVISKCEDIYSIHSW